MRHFASALIASMGSAQWINWPITVDGNAKTVYIDSKDWSQANYIQNEVFIGANNSLFVRDTTDETHALWSMYNPYIRGGAVEYDINVSGVQSGCVAGVYLVDTSSDAAGCHEKAQTSEPQCKTIDVMQANRYGFETKANPCDGGNCNAVSQCALRMRNQGAAVYGSGAYGPGGSMIDTDFPFHVKNEFISTPDYQKLWKLRTRITQGSDEIVMEADCRDSLVGLN